MDILIKGMEMPKDDMKNIMILSDGRVFQFSGYGNPKPLGTAVPVPPHGRLIDADALEDNNITYYAIPVLKTVTDAAIREVELVIKLKDLDAAPTIIPAEDGE